MRIVLHRPPVVVALVVMAVGLGGCGTINGWLSAGFEDYIPAWAGGLPADAPPRPGTLQYDEWMKQRERQRLEAAVKKDDSGTTAPSTSASSSLGPVH
jgi:hypothetical protein